jgi:hypothetical protein
MLLPSQVSSQPRRFGSRLALIYASDGLREPQCHCAAPRPRQSRTIGGNTEQGYGTACRQPGGRWQIVQ